MMIVIGLSLWTLSAAHENNVLNGKKIVVFTRQSWERRGFVLNKLIVMFLAHISEKTTGSNLFNDYSISLVDQILTKGHASAK